MLGFRVSGLEFRVLRFREVKGLRVAEGLGISGSVYGCLVEDV